MELIKHGELYGKEGSDLFVWDSEWEIFRPIEKVGWTGKKIDYVDYIYKQNIFDPWYGFGSAEMKHRCQKLTETADLTIFSEDVTKLFKDSEWLKDRKIPLLPCSPRTSDSWSKYLKHMKYRHKTLRNFKDLRKTRRIF